MKKLLSLTLFLYLSNYTSASAQRAIGARALVLDDNSGHKLTITYPHPVDATLSLPSGSGNNGEVLTSDGQGGTQWSAAGSSVLPSGAYAAFASSSAVSGYTYTGVSQRIGDTWNTKASDITAQHASAISMINGKIYVIGGSTSPVSGQIINNNEYDPATNSWTAKAALPTARRYVMSATANNKLYVIGGSIGAGAGTPQTVVEEYDPSTNTWATKAPMPTARMAGVACTVNGKIYVIAGNDGGSTFFSTNEEYDPSTNTWATKASIPNGWASSGAAVANSKIYVLGGQDNSSTYAQNAEYDPATNTWSLKSALPTATTGLSAVGLNNKVYYFGGCLASANIPFNTATVYDPATDTYTSLTNMNTARIGPMSVVGSNGKCYVIGGANSAGTRLTANEELTLGIPLYWFTKN